MQGRIVESGKRVFAAEGGHVPALDGMRGLAVLSVLGSHLLFGNNESASRLIQVVLSLRDLLWVGVTLFFSLSGFLITGILFDTLGSQKYFRTFFGRRCLRIFPLYYGVLLVLLLLTRPLHMDWHGQAYRLLTYTPNLPFAFEWGANPSPYVNLRHFWSLAVEEQFYILWPLLVFWLRSWRKIFVATLFGSGLALILRTVIAFEGYSPQNHALPFCMDSLLLGGALALLVRSDYRERTLRWGLPVFLATTAITLAEAFTHPDFTWQSSLYLTTIGMTILPLGTTGLIAAAIRPGSVAQAICSTGILRFFGRYSYGLYVYHYSIDTSLTTPLRTGLVSRGFSSLLATLVAAGIVGGLTIVLAVLSYQLYEKHFLRLKRYFPYRKKVGTGKVAELREGALN